MDPRHWWPRNTHFNRYMNLYSSTILCVYLPTPCTTTSYYSIHLRPVASIVNRGCSVYVFSFYTRLSEEIVYGEFFCCYVRPFICDQVIFPEIPSKVRSCNTGTRITSFLPMIFRVDPDIHCYTICSISTDQMIAVRQL